jgi:hypothetical protein
MIIKSNYNKFNFLSIKNLLIFSSLLIGFVFVAFFFLKVKNYEPYDFVKNYFTSYKYSPKKLYLNIKQKNYLNLINQRENALKGDKNYSYVKGSIDFNQKNVNVDVRLKGDRMIHLDPHKLSFRVKANGDNTILGMKRFSLHSPKARNFIYEWLFHKLLKNEGLISIRYDFVDLILNGKNLGIYALEEHFDKRLIENNNMKEGPIVRFNENLIVNDFYTGINNLNNTPISIFNENEFLQTEKAHNIEIAISMLESFRNGNSKISEVFDVVKMAKFFAVTDLLDSHHGAIWRSLRFYLNPVTMKLEPIGFDGHFGAGRFKTMSAELGSSVEPTWINTVYADWFNIVFNNKSSIDLNFYKEYVKALEKLSNNFYLTEFFDKNRKEINQLSGLIHREFPYYDFDKNNFFENQILIKRMLNPKQGINVYTNSFHNINDLLEFEIANTTVLPIQIIKFSFNDSLSYELKNDLILTPKHPTDLMSFKNIETKIKNDSILIKNFKDWKVHYKIVGSSKEMSSNIFPYKRNANFKFSNNISLSDNKFLIVNENEKTIKFSKKNVTLNKDLIIPNGYKFIIESGLELNFINNANLLSYSDTYFSGKIDDQIKISSYDKSGGGILIIGSQVHLNNVNFNGVSRYSNNLQNLTGAINFYECDVTIDNTFFNDNIIGDDYVNIIRSDFSINNSTFTNIYADALDSDFSTGKITNTNFYKIGNDAIDISGTYLDMENINIDGAMDKGISAGEKSTIVSNFIKIQNSEIAISSKDLSKIMVENLYLDSNRVNYTAFQKKPEFGGGIIKAFNIESSNYEIDYLVELNSEIYLNNNLLKVNAKEVEKSLYGVDYGKKSK